MTIDCGMHSSKFCNLMCTLSYTIIDYDLMKNMSRAVPRIAVNEMANSQLF